MSAQLFFPLVQIRSMSGRGVVEFATEFGMFATLCLPPFHEDHICSALSGVAIPRGWHVSKAVPSRCYAFRNLLPSGHCVSLS